MQIIDTLTIATNGIGRHSYHMKRTRPSMPLRPIIDMSYRDFGGVQLLACPNHQLMVE
jgi:hypothetical protein